MTAYRRLGHPDLSVNIGYAPYMDRELVHSFCLQVDEAVYDKLCLPVEHHAKIMKTKF